MIDIILRLLGRFYFICAIAFVGGLAIATTWWEWSGSRNSPSDSPVVFLFGTIAICGFVGALASLLIGGVIARITRQQWKGF